MNFKKAGLIAAAILAFLFLVGFLIPNKYVVEREATIIAAPKMIFAFVGDLARWNDWTTWAKMDPEMKTETSTPSFGVGASQKWASKKMGEGSTIVTEWTADHSIGFDLNFGDFPQSHAAIQMSPAPQGAKLTWRFEGEVGTSSPQRWFGLLMRFFIGKDLKNSLENLRKLCEGSVAAEVHAPWDEATPVAPSKSAPHAAKKLEPAPGAKSKPVPTSIAPAVLPMPDPPSKK